MNVLVLNCGSSSVRFQLVQTDPASADAGTDRALARGHVENIGGPALLKYEAADGRTLRESSEILEHKIAVEQVLALLTRADVGVVKDRSEIDAVGHRVVHGGERFKASVRIDDGVVEGIEQCFDLAPLHNPPNVKGYRAARELLGDAAPQVAVFDTAFHQTMPATAYLYGLPYVLYERHGIRRYGFHGTSHRFVAARLAARLGRRLDDPSLRLITCHLGNGCSVAAIKGGRSVDTSMGFTPLEGLVMGTRSGDLDPAILLHVMGKEELGSWEMNALLNKHSGLIGISGVSNDMRTLLEAEESGNARARQAVDVFCYRLMKYIASYIGALEGVDGIAFAGGIGENAPAIRRRTLAPLAALGVRLDEARNLSVRGQEGEVSAEGSAARAFVIPTNEELLIARDTMRLVSGLPPFMTPRTTRVIRGGLLAGMAVLAAVVTRSLSQSSRAPRPTTAASPSGTESPTTATRMEGFTHFRMEMGATKFSIKAKSYTGKEGEEMHLQGVEVQFTYMAKGKEGKSTITSDESVYNPILQKAVFRGNVHVVTEDGFAFDTASLVYRGDKNLSRTEDPVRFQRKDLSGSATGVVYDAAAGRLELMADVVLKLQDPDNQPMDITSARAVFERQEGLLKFIDKVEVVQGADRLTAGRFLVNIADDTQAVYRAQAIDDVNLWMGGGALGQGLTPSSAGRGPRHLAGRKLDLWFRPDRTLQDATAGPDAVLTIQPGKGDPPEKRILKARFLGFAFDERGKLSELRGQKDSSFVAQALPPSKAATRTLTCQSFIARVDPASGEPSLIEFTKDVVFVEGTQRATGEKAYFDGKKSALFLQEGPALADTAQGSKLTAKVIQIATRSGDLQAHDDVRHILDKPGADGGLLGGKGGSTLLAADRFEYSASTKLAHYRQSALLRTGKDEIRADEIRIQELAGGKRRLEAAGSVVSRMYPAAEKDAAKPAALVEARAREMIYEEGKNEIVYTGDVIIRQGDIQTASPKATLKLLAGGNTIDTLVAGEPVEVQQGVRKATGARATYTPRTETMLLVGESVVLKDPTQELKGRSLTFHVGDARILVDGREQVRTELIIRQDKPKQ